MNGQSLTFSVQSIGLAVSLDLVSGEVISREGGNRHGFLPTRMNRSRGMQSGDSLGTGSTN